MLMIFSLCSWLPKLHVSYKEEEEEEEEEEEQQQQQPCPHTRH